jgi:AAA domain
VNAVHECRSKSPRARIQGAASRSFHAAKSASQTGIPALVALSSALLGRPLQYGGGINLGGSIEPVHNPIDVVEHALSKGAATVLLGSSVQVGGGTAWLWSRQDAAGTLDVLFADEAAQMSLANVLAVSQAAKTVVLIGDPQQLDQPIQDSHPDGADISALAHMLGDERTIPLDRGLFLEKNWRLHPSTCQFTSGLFYAGELRSRSGLERQAIRSSGPISGSGLRYLPVVHTGNQNCSPEEASAVSDLVTAVLANGATWVDGDGKEKPLTLDDIMIITPYNAQVFEIQRRLPGAHIGTVDKFQGQEAPIAIYPRPRPAMPMHRVEWSFSTA